MPETVKARAVPMDPGLQLSREDRAKLNSEELQYADKLPYRELVGSLMYAATCTRPDTMFAVSVLSRFLDCHAITHWRAAKAVLSYLSNKQDLGLS